jgi:hypothetical protein
MYTTLITSLVWGLFQAPRTLASCAHGTHLYRREAGGGVEIPDFDYRTTKGPTNWHSISPNNTLCGVGTTQSPIILDSAIPIEGRGFVQMAIAPQHDLPFENLGTTVEVVVDGTTVVGNASFTLKQFHFHTPSEHRIDGEYFPVEVHFVHQAQGDHHYPIPSPAFATKTNPLTSPPRFPRQPFQNRRGLPSAPTDGSRVLLDGRVARRPRPRPSDRNARQQHRPPRR